jgi:hypothetical protein
VLNYRLPSGLPAGSRAAWSRFIFLPFGASWLMPLSYSVLAEIAGRAWFAWYDSLGFDPIPRARVVRNQNGRPLFNLTLSAQREAEHASIEPITFEIDGEAFPLAKVEKAGFLAGIKAGRNEKKLDERLVTLANEVGAMRNDARAWYEKVSSYRWTQAEILMVMEEIEPISVKPFSAYLGARQGILLAATRLMRWSSQAAAATLEQIDRGMGGSAGVIEADMARRLAAIAAKVPAPMRSEMAGAPAEACEETLRKAGILEDARAMLADYGHYATAPGEVAEPRWVEEPALLMRSLASPPAAPAASDEPALSALRASIDQANRKAADSEIASLRLLIPLQSQALDALSLILAGTRKWAWGAAREAALDQRIVSLDNVFCYELEELKEMMTGEWNISDRAGIQNLAEKRRAQVAVWRDADAPDLMIGDSPAATLDGLRPSVTVQPAQYLSAAQQAPA